MPAQYSHEIMEMGENALRLRFVFPSRWKSSEDDGNLEEVCILP